jgi:hypothetical protein
MRAFSHSRILTNRSRHCWTRILCHVLVLLWVVYPTHQLLNLKLLNL